jgi:hypothetical protein
METINVQTVIGPDGMVRIAVPSRLPPGPAEVVLVIGQTTPRRELRWRDFYGLGQELWGDEDAQAYVNRLRDEWDHEPAG